MFPHQEVRQPNFWLNKLNQQKFFEDIAKTLAIKRSNEWGAVKVQQIVNLGGGTLMVRNRGSLKRALCAAFPGFHLLRVTLRCLLAIRMVSSFSSSS